MRDYFVHVLDSPTEISTLALACGKYTSSRRLTLANHQFAGKQRVRRDSGRFETTAVTSIIRIWGYISSLPFRTMSFSLNLYLRTEVPSFVANSTSLSSIMKGIERGNANTTSIVFPGLATSIWVAFSAP